MAAADFRLLTDATGQRMAAALEGMSVDRAAKTDLTSIIATGTTNTTGAAIAAGTYFYLNGALVHALTNIASGATFTNGTNYEAVTAGGLNSLNDQIANIVKIRTLTSTTDSDGLVSLVMPSSDNVVICVVDNDNTKKNIYLPFKYLGIWHARVTTDMGATLASTSCDMKVYYFM